MQLHSQDLWSGCRLRNQFCADIERLATALCEALVFYEADLVSESPIAGRVR
jgi:hypothetical protein